MQPNPSEYLNNGGGPLPTRCLVNRRTCLFTFHLPLRSAKLYYCCYSLSLCCLSPAVAWHTFVGGRVFAEQWAIAVSVCGLYTNWNSLAVTSVWCITFCRYYETWCLYSSIRLCVCVWWDNIINVRVTYVRRVHVCGRYKCAQLLFTKIFSRYAYSSRMRILVFCGTPTLTKGHIVWQWLCT